LELIKTYLIVIIGILTIISFTIVKLFCDFNFYSESILAVTAVIILWYTHETSEIRKSENIIADATKENQQRFRSPIINCSIFKNKNDPLDTRVRVSNLSNFPVAVRLNCNIKIDGEILKDFSPDYNGRNYWNLQYGEIKEGHFSWLDLFMKKGLLSEEEFQNIRENSIPNGIKKADEYLAFKFNFNIPKITMDIEVYCENEMGLNTYYPPVHYYYNFDQWSWIPVITSDKPYWEYDSKPIWINN